VQTWLSTELSAEPGHTTVPFIWSIGIKCTAACHAAPRALAGDAVGEGGGAARGWRLQGVELSEELEGVGV
jgi:hypothetical protein